MDMSGFGDVVFQPGVQPGRGVFRVEVGGDADGFGDVFSVTTQSCKVQCPDPPDPDNLVGCGGREAIAGSGCCQPPESISQPPLCDLLVFKPGVHVGTSTSGEFVIQYVPEGMPEQPINITVRFSKHRQ